jgi:putative RecB family exonuclease
VPSQSELDEDRQLALYQIALARTRGVTGAVRLVWHFVRPGVVRVSERGPEALRALESATLDLVERVRSEKEFAPVPGRLCAWCEYKDGCPASPVRRDDVPAYAVEARGARRGAGSGAQLALPL